MHRYEALMLTVPEITADEAKTIEQQVDRLVSEKKGTLLSFERWGKYRLAYPIQKNEYGVYFLVRFETAAPQPLVSEVDTLLAVKLHDFVMRYMVTKLDPKQPLDYQRPQSLEEVPTREIGAFMKEDRNSDHHSSLTEDMDSDNQEL